LGKKLIDIAVESGADAVKFQTFKTENIITPEAPKSTYHVETTGSDNTQTWFQLLKTQEMSRNMHVNLIDYCIKRRIIFLSTPYDNESADLLEELDIPAFKIASTDTSNIPLLSYIARKGRPMILSSAMATLEEVENAVAALRKESLKDIAVLQCTGNYPAKLEESNLRVIKTFIKKLNCIVGYSDHTSDMINPVAATAMGAKIYEKHFTIDKTMQGPDHRMSLNPNELKSTIKAIKETERAMGSSVKQVLEIEKENRVKLRKSIVANTDIRENEIIYENMIGIKRPGNGIQPCDLNKVIGKKTKFNILSGTVINLDMISE
ncbi:N-acetylneuraminate synthase family protein, partial [bacterium]|nr:N-acetylneuraminate synthase family protein [bacterium]